jgi:ABC-type transport system involved in multi-copper enzyme maturation permease subunit
MLTRIGTIALNTYREAVRARLLYGLFGLSIATAGYCLVVGAYSLRSSLRVVSDLGALSVSVYAVVVAMVLGATSLYRELELKTIFPILARPVRRTEYLVGKYLGMLCTLLVIVASNVGVLLLSLGLMAEGPWAPALAALFGSVALAGLAAWRLPRFRTYVPIPWALLLAVAGALLAAGAPDDRRVILGSAVLTLCEVSVVAAIATLFSSFTSPFLTAIFTFGLFVIGRSADALARLPEKFFGSVIYGLANGLSKVVPNLMLFVPPRPLLTGEESGSAFGPYLLLCATHAIAWSVGLLALSSLLFRRRDFL